MAGNIKNKTVVTEMHAIRRRVATIAHLDRIANEDVKRRIRIEGSSLKLSNSY